MVLPSPDTNTYIDKLIERSFSLLGDIAPKTVQKEKVGERERKKKTSNEVKPTSNTNK